MAKGDYVSVTTRTGTQFVVKADIGGRKVETDWVKEGNIQWYEARVVTRGGTPVETLRFPTDEIIAIQSQIREAK